jgi:hypothetical protein
MVPSDLGPIKLARPENWQISMPKQQGDFVTIAPPAGIIQSGVGYGVLINGVGTNGERMTIDEVTTELVQNLQRTQGLQPLGKPQPITVAGAQGRAVALQSTSPFPASNGQQQKERDWLVTVRHPSGQTIFFVFVAPESDFARFQPAFQSMLKSVQF